jgi:hypothetical protein
MLRAAASLLLIAWLPGALAFRLPYWDRERRAALAAEERLFWQVIIGSAISHVVVLALAAAHRYSFQRLLVVDAGLCLLLAAASRLRLRLGGPLPSRSALAVVALIALSGIRFFPPSEYIIGGRDPGSYINEGIVIAQRGTLVYEDPTVAAVPPFARDLFFPSHGRADYYGTRFMGFFIKDPETGRVVGQFPHLLPASVAIGYGIDGLTGARYVLGVWATLGILATYFAGARWVGRPAAAAAAALLTLNVIEVWFGRYPNAEVVMQALVFAGLLANARAHFDAPKTDRFFAVVGGSLLGLLLFLRFDAVLAIGAAVFGNLLASLRGRRVSFSFAAALTLTMVMGVIYLLGPMRAYATYPIDFVRNLRWWHVTGLGLAALGAPMMLMAARRMPRFREAAERRVPLVLIGTVWLLAIYALFLRTPAGKLALENAYALRMFASFYVTLPCVLAALLGYALVVRRRFWHDPAIVMTITLFSVFFFYKIRIHAEHFWAARRFLPVILPGTLLLASAAATWGLARTSPRGRLVSGTIGLAFLGVLAVQYIQASAPVARHIEYAGLIPHLESLARTIGDRDLLLVESRDAQSEAHVFALPLAYVYDRSVLVLNSAAPDLSTFAAFYEWARTRYEHVYFLGGGGTLLLSQRTTAAFLSPVRFRVPEYATAFNAYPPGPRHKTYDFGLYELRPRNAAESAGMWFNLDVGSRDDLHVLRFHAKEQVASGETIRWSQEQSVVAVTMIGPQSREVVLVMSNGGRPANLPSADVAVSFNGQLLGTAHVVDGFRPYTFTIPPPLAAAAAARDAPAQLTLRTSTWRPRDVLGGTDDRRLGVMLDRVQVR